MARTSKIKLEYEDLKKDLTREITAVDSRMIRPAQGAKDSLGIFRKTIRKREDKKLDYERYQNRVDTSLKKTKRSERENAVLAKSQADLEVATQAYNAADDHIRNTLPQILTSVFSLLPHLLAAQIQIQNSLLANYYTMLHNYCTQEGFQSPSPPMDEIVRLWEAVFKPAQQQIESTNIIVNGKAIKASMKLENGQGSTNGYRRPSQVNSRQPSVSPARVLPPSPVYDTKSKSSSSPSPSTTSLLSPIEAIASPSPSASVYQTPMSFSSAGPNSDYFSRDRQPSAACATTPGSLASTIAGKKKPPPPPPPRIPSSQYIFVTALYDFAGQGEGDLVFKEGDRIKVIKKTDSTDDWWQGELRGIKGPFPANYCQ